MSKHTMAQLAKTNLKATATVKSEMSQADELHYGLATEKMGLLDTLKSMTHTCNKRMQDVNDCGAFHTELLETGYDYPAACELERMDRMAARLQEYYLKMRHMWQNNNDDECPLEHLDEIATNVTNLGDMVRQLVKAAYQYKDFHRAAEEEESRGRTTVDEQQKDRTSEEDEYKSTMYAISMENRKRAEEWGDELESGKHVDIP